jgi:hypothetical protein
MERKMENKFKVIEMYPEIKGAQLMADWLNERYALGEELVAVYKDKFIFKNKFYTTVKTVEDYLEV